MSALDRKLSVKELAYEWGWKAGRIYRLVALGRIPHVRVGGGIYFEPAALEAWLNAQPSRSAREHGRSAKSAPEWADVPGANRYVS